ncbi:MAG: segregation and condensation protein A [Gammaproteobacteria bacterium]|nr:segregation and condensation protein A [Gammaproteobacteria bacterium]MCP5135624.1 segregation and condensation protein A [Gammaproteobacteria bacterium]
MTDDNTPNDTTSSDIDAAKLSKEQKVMRAMRKTLGIIIRETTPQPGMHHPLSRECIEDMRQCLALIAAREREIGEELGLDMNMRPVYRDSITRSAKVVPLSSIGRKNKDSE